MKVTITIECPNADDVPATLRLLAADIERAGKEAAATLEGMVSYAGFGQVRVFNGVLAD